MKINLKTIHQHAVLRILCLPAYVFTALLLIKLSEAPEVFWNFLTSYKGAAIFSLILIISHSTQELIVALEDYLPDIKRRSMAIKITALISFFSVAIASFTLWRI